MMITQNQGRPMSKIKTHWVDWCKNDPVDSGWCALLLAHLQWLWVTSEASSSFSRCSCSASQCQRKSRPWYTLLYIHGENGLTYCYSFFITRSPDHSSFMAMKHLREIRTRSPLTGALSMEYNNFSISNQWLARPIARNRYKIAP